ncbi:MAG: hypothetical protein JXX14_19700 [Deltaproteobacteria bacterium]|nr:hypothetical protein [Deltaproteobacteria bacterium]
MTMSAFVPSALRRDLQNSIFKREKKGVFSREGEYTPGNVSQVTRDAIPPPGTDDDFPGHLDRTKAEFETGR